MILLKKIGIVVLFLLSSMMVSGQVSVSASLDSATIVMGQQAIVHFSVTQPQNKAVQMPVFSDQLADGLQIVEIKGDTVVTGNNITINQDIIVTSFQPGSYKIPPFVCKDESRTYQTKALNLVVRDVKIQFEEGHIPEDIMNIYDPPTSPYVLVTLVAALVLSILLLVLGVFYWRKHRTDPEPYVHNNEVSMSAQPEVTALELIRKMGEDKIWQMAGNEKKFFTQLTDVLRQYFERRYKIHAMEMTSSELVDALRKVDVPIELRDLVRDVCFTGDMTKFAKHHPSDGECMHCVEMAEQAILKTSPVEEPSESKTPQQTKPAE